MVDVVGNRSASKYTGREQVARVAWALFRPFFFCSPRVLWGWRRILLRSFGAKIGKHVHIYPSVRIVMPWNLEVEDFAAVGDRVTLYCLGPVHIGARATISQGSHLCAGSHDITSDERTLIKPPIYVSGDVWIAADVFVGPGVTIGEAAIVGARAVVMKNVEPKAKVVGNPAKVVGYLV